MGKTVSDPFAWGANLAIIPYWVQIDGDSEYMVVQCLLHLWDSLLVGVILNSVVYNILGRQEKYLQTL